MAHYNFLGWKRSTLAEFYAWQGTDRDPAKGTVNFKLGFNHTKNTWRYTYPKMHKDSTVDMDEYKMPIEGTIRGDETDVIYIITDMCPGDKIPSDLLTDEEFRRLDWGQKLDE